MNRFELVAVHTQQPANQNAPMEGPGLRKVLAPERSGDLPGHLSGRSFVHAMETYGVTIGQVARWCQCDRKRVSRWRAGSRIDDESLDRMGPVGTRYRELMAIEQIVRRVG